MPAPIPSYSRPLPQPGGSTWTPPPTAWEGFSATVRDAFNHNIGRDESNGDAAYDVLIQPLVDMGNPMDRYLVPTIGGPVMNRQAIYADALAARAKDPKKFTSLPQSQAEYDKQWRGEFQADMAKDSAIISRTGWAPWLAGGIVGGMTNPINLASLGVGGAGGGLMRVIAREALVNAVISAVDQPFQALEAGAQGRQFTAGEAATNIAFGAAAGAAFGGAIHGAGIGWEAAKPVLGNVLNRVSDPFAQAMAKNWDRLPSGLQERWLAAAKVDGAPITDSLIADTSEAVIGRDYMAGHEAAAVGLLRREGQIDGASPFTASGAGDSAHREALAEVLTRIMADQRGGLPVRQRLNTGTGLSGGSVMGDPVSIFSTRLAGVESGGNDFAQAATSSALGRYQFTRGTWLNYFRQRFGETGLSEAEILAKRTNPAVQNTVMAHASADYQAKLRGMGEAVTPGNLYIMHFAGETRARKLFAAEAGASAESVMGKAAVDANPWMRDMTAGELLAWADRKMGGDGTVLRGPGPEIDPAAVPDPAMREAMQAEIDTMRLDNARMRAELTGESASVSRAVEEASAVDAVAVDHEPIAPEPMRQEPATMAMDENAPPVSPLSVETRAVMPELRRIAEEKGRSLNDVAALANELGVGEDDIRQGLMKLVMDGAITLRRDGQFTRAKAPAQPDTLLYWINKRGGIEDIGGEVRHMDGHKWHVYDPPLERVVQRGKRKGSLVKITHRIGRKPLIRERAADGAVMDANKPDVLFRDAIEAGYFPEVAAAMAGDASYKPDLNQFWDAVRRELNGEPVYNVADKNNKTVWSQTHEGPTFDEMLAQYGADETGQDLSAWPTPDSRSDMDRAFDAWGQFEPAEQSALQARLESAGLTHGDVDPWIWQRTAELADTFSNDHPMQIGQAFETAVDDYARATMRDMYRETGDPGYSEADYEWHDQGPDTGPQDFYDAESGWGQPVDPADPNAGSAGGQAAAGSEAAGPALSDLPQEETTRFLDPEGEAAKAQADDLLHDAQAEVASVEDPAIAARQIQEAQLRAQAPLRGENRTGQAQDGTMGLGLFDAADQPTFRLDAEGPEMTMPDLLKMLDEEQADIDAMRTCMVPMPKPKGE